MKIPRHVLLDEMRSITVLSIQKVSGFRDLPLERLLRQPSPGAWNALQCLEHLARYGDHYLPAMEKGILAYQGSSGTDPFTTGLLGGYFARMMRGKNGRITKLSSPKPQNPMDPDLPITTIDRFLHQQEELLRLIDRARTVDLRRIRIPISLNRMVRLRLGDTFRFLLYHVERHLDQAERALVSG